MTISVLDIGAGSNNSGATLTLSNVTVPDGATIVAQFYERTSTVANGAVTDTAGNAYTLITTGAPNGSQATNGIGQLYVAKNIKALASGVITYTKITSGSSTGGGAMAVLHSSGQDGFFGNNATGNSASPSTVSLAGNANELIIGGVIWAGATTDTFTQDSANGAYAAPIDYDHSIAGCNEAGGNFIKANPGLATFAPTITSNPWWVWIIAFIPTAATAGPIGFSGLPPVVNQYVTITA